MSNETTWPAPLIPARWCRSSHRVGDLGRRDLCCPVVGDPIERLVAGTRRDRRHCGVGGRFVDPSRGRAERQCRRNPRSASAWRGRSDGRPTRRRPGCPIDRRHGAPRSGSRRAPAGVDRESPRSTNSANRTAPWRSPSCAGNHDELGPASIGTGHDHAL